MDLRFYNIYEITFYGWYKLNNHWVEWLFKFKYKKCWLVD